jgi:peptidoglycan hydrolase-like amidase
MRVPCEALRNQLRLPSCPDRITPSGDAFVFHGTGEGHGAGLDVTEANAAAAEGADFRALLDRAYPGLVLRPATSP